MATLYETIEHLCQINEIDITTMCRESGASRGSLTDLKKKRIVSLSATTLDRIASYFHVTIDFLLDEDDNKYDRLGGGQNKIIVHHWPEDEKKPPAENDEELDELLERVRDDPHMRMLFSLTKDATAEDIEKAIKIIQMLKGE